MRFYINFIGRMKRLSCSDFFKVLQGVLEELVFCLFGFIVSVYIYCIDLFFLFGVRCQRLQQFVRIEYRIVGYFLRFIWQVFLKYFLVEGERGFGRELLEVENGSCIQVLLLGSDRILWLFCLDFGFVFQVWCWERGKYLQIWLGFFLDVKFFVEQQF